MKKWMTATYVVKVAGRKGFESDAKGGTLTFGSKEAAQAHLVDQAALRSRAKRAIKKIR